MGYTIDGAIKRFQTLASQGIEGHSSRKLIDDGYLIEPNGYQPKPNAKKIALTIMGITHGNEWAGVGIVNGILEYLHSGMLKLPVPVAFVLGNPNAARKNIRFIDRDLNRSFDREGSELAEDKRAREIETVLKETGLLVDFHQTMLRCDRSFFIFPHSKPSLEFARAINPRQTIVTHWGRSFSTDGRCTDEFVNMNGGIGISMETGQNGFDPGQIATGIDAAVWAIRVAAERAGVMPSIDRKAEALGEIMTFSEILPWPDGGQVTLKPDFYNFMPFEAGASVGKVGDADIIAAEGGRIIFPKYLTAEQQKQLKAPPSELCRFMKVVAESELPK